MQVATPVSGELSTYLDLVARRMELISNNVANVDTPGFHTRDIDFTKALHTAMSGSAAGAQKARAQEVRGLVERPDGNNVQVDRETMAMAQVQLQFRTASALLKREFQRVSDAIKDDK